MDGIRPAANRKGGKGKLQVILLFAMLDCDGQLSFLRFHGARKRNARYRERRLSHVLTQKPAYALGIAGCRGQMACNPQKIKHASFMRQTRKNLKLPSVTTFCRTLREDQMAGTPKES